MYAEKGKRNFPRFIIQVLKKSQLGKSFKIKGATYDDRNHSLDLYMGGMTNYAVCYWSIVHSD